MIALRSSRRSFVLSTTAGLLTAFCLATSTGLVACGGSHGEAKTAKVQAGNMPADGEWTGVYYSTVYGHLHLVKEGDTISGKWRTTNGDKWGEMSGKVTGDLFRYEWREHIIGVVGPTSTTSGQGYFRYVVPKGDNVEHEIHGEWGLGMSNAGQKWDAVKQRNQQPDPDSVMPDETQGASVDEWDEKPHAKKKPKSDDGDNSSGSNEWE
ncbi:MAG TPA: hypothetical protein VL137_12580 [Polyangiaceae bacterium]|nr:hypothetical protein [Polyangiaceae bacterium]